MSEKLHVLAVGPSHCGKTELLHRLYVPRFPHVISLDVNGEARRYNAQAIECTTIEAIVDVATVGAHLGKPWHVQAVLERSDYPALFRLLAPPYKGESAPMSFSRAAGGIAVECSEAYAFIPNQGAHPDIREAFYRNRHHYLSFLIAAQRPTTLDVVARTQADVIVAFRETDPNELHWLGEIFGVDNLPAIQRLPPFYAAVYLKNEARIWWLDAGRNVVRVTPRYAQLNTPLAINKGGANDGPAE